MMGGYIDATTAFIVVNELIQSIWGWLTPFYYWNFIHPLLDLEDE